MHQAMCSFNPSRLDHKSNLFFVLLNCNFFHRHEQRPCYHIAERHKQRVAYHIGKYDHELFHTIFSSGGEKSNAEIYSYENVDEFYTFNAADHDNLQRVL